MAAKPTHLLLLGCRGVGKTKMMDRYADARRELSRNDQIRLKYGLLGKMLHGMSASEVCKTASW